MSRYFMGDTRLSGLERMMMDPSRSAPDHTECQQSQLRKETLSSQQVSEGELKEDSE